MGGPDHNEVEVIGILGGEDNSCIGHQPADHLHASPVGLKVDGKPTVCGGTDYEEIAVTTCRSLDLETGLWSDSFPMNLGRYGAKGT